jgi:signal transduction histidine kinase
MLRRMRPLGFAVFVVVLAVAAHDAPGSAPSGPLLVTLLPLLGVVGGGVGVLLIAPRPGGPVAVQAAVFTVLVVASAAMVRVEPNGPGFVGGFLAAGAATSRLPQRTAAAVAGITLAALAVGGIVGRGSPLAIVLNELGALAFYRVGSFARRLRDRTEQTEKLLVELEQTRDAQLRAATLAERQRLAREMHDVLAHSLSGLLLHLEGARLLAGREAAHPRLVDGIERAHHLAENGLEEARQAIGMLRGEDLPGPERLRTLAAEFERDNGIRCELVTVGPAATLTAQARLTLYRVAQEALTNVGKHARADRVGMRLEYQPDGTRLTVEDFAANGVPPGPAGDRGYGLSGMRERAELLGGTLSAAPGERGFRVSLWIPR